MQKIKLSIIVTARDKEDSKLKDFLESVSKQSYPKELIEIIIATEGNSESAKGIALKKAKGKIVSIFASDNYLSDKDFISKCMKPFEIDRIVGSYPHRYEYRKDDDILNRYFSLMGVNDVIPFYLRKQDRQSYLYPNMEHAFLEGHIHGNKVPTLGDNGFFIRRGVLLQADIEHYYHIDVCQDLLNKGYRNYALVNTTLWHRTGGNIFKFFFKRFKYAFKFSSGRRWNMVTKKDTVPLLYFIFSTLLIVPCLLISIKGHKRVKDIAWFMHYPVCLLTLLTYGLFALSKPFRR